MLLICKSLLFLFCVFMIKGDDALTEISPFEAKWDEQKINIHFSQPVETKIMKIRMYHSKLIKNLFFITWLWTCVLSGKMEHTLYRHKNITEPDHLSGHIFHINTQLLCHHKNFLYASCTFLLLSQSFEIYLLLGENFN